jgi:TolB-like protein/Tfp pilus assembly protein PilF
VLPFENLSGDPEQQFFSDGVTEDVITDLSRFRQLFVIARNSSFAFRGKNEDAGEIGRKLGVQYLVEGSVRRSGDRIRISAQLVDTTSGTHLWAERYDRELKDLFAVQSELAQTLASTLVHRIELADRERAVRKSANDLNAYECFLRGLEHFRRLTDEDIDSAVVQLERAIHFDPNFALPHAFLALVNIELWYDRQLEGSLRKALELARKAVALDPNESESHIALANVYLAERQLDRAEAQMRQAIAVNANHAHAISQLGWVCSYSGRPKEALEHIDQAIRLNPFHPDWYDVFRAQALYFQHRYAEAANAVSRITSTFHWDRMYAAACCAMAGDTEQARHHAAEVLTQRPGFSSQDAVSKESYRNEAYAQLLSEGLLKAGLPP